MVSVAAVRLMSKVDTALWKNFNPAGDFVIKHINVYFYFMIYSLKTSEEEDLLPDH